MLSTMDQARRFDAYITRLLIESGESLVLRTRLTELASKATPGELRWNSQRFRASVIGVAPTRYNDVLRGRRGNPSPVPQWLQAWHDRVVIGCAGPELAPNEVADILGVLAVRKEG